MTFQPLKLDHLIEVTDIITIHYFEYDSSFVFPGEQHDFWEFLCVDEGRVTVTAEKETFSLDRDDIIFHQPNEFHGLRSGLPAPSLVVISFASHSPAMNFFRQKRLRIDLREREILSSIVAEAKQIFQDPLDNPAQKGMRLRKDAPSSSLQMIALHLELFLLHLYNRSLAETSRETDDSHSLPEKSAPAFPSSELPAAKVSPSTPSLLAQIDHYLLAHLSDSLTVEKIARDNLISVSRLEHLIRSQYRCGVIHHFIALKIEKAKRLIRDRDLNFSQIAGVLGYPSVHYFSRQFKRVTGMTPSAYSRSIKRSMDAADDENDVPCPR